MKRPGTAKFPQSEQLFKFCQKVLIHQRGTKKVKDQEIGKLLEFNPSDCSHWKRGDKNIKSVFALAKIAEGLTVDSSLVHDVASGLVCANEALFEFLDRGRLLQFQSRIKSLGKDRVSEIEARIESFVSSIHDQANFATAPLYLPEVFRNFSYISTQPVEMLDDLSRILRIRDGEFCIQYKKGPLRAQTRHSITKDFARILLHAERARFPEIGEANSDELGVEAVLFVANLLVPQSLLRLEMTKLDVRKNLVSELSNIFWAPKILVSLQLNRMLSNDLSVSQSAQQNIQDGVNTPDSTNILGASA